MTVMGAWSWPPSDTSCVHGHSCMAEHPWAGICTAVSDLGDRVLFKDKIFRLTWVLERHLCTSGEHLDLLLGSADRL